MIATRGEAIRELLAAEELDAILLFGLPQIRYLCGFTGTDGVLLVTPDQSVFLTDSRYLSQAEAQTQVDLVNCYKSKFAGIAELLKRQMCQRIGFDADALTVTSYNDLTKLMPDSTDWVPLSSSLRTLRATKSTEEIALLRQAANLNREAFAEVLPHIKPGVSERQIALDLEFALKKRGGEVNAFDFIVASGERGALPHGVASEKLVQAGELVTIDFGTRIAGYHSDETITLAVGQVDRNLRQIFDIVLKAHDLALEALRPGMSIPELDAVARDYISEQGYGDYFGHGLGHGVGLEIHEYPAISQKTEAQIEEGMVITIEPGIYIPKLGGVRIEDTVVVTADGYDALTSIPKQFRELAI